MGARRGAPAAPRTARELTLAIGDAGTPEEVLALTASASPAPNGRNCLAALSALGRARNTRRILRTEPASAAAFEAVLERTWDELPAMGPDQQAQVLWALAKSGVKPGPERRRAFFKSARGVQTSMSPQWHSSLLWAASKLQVYPGAELLEEAEAQVADRLQDYNTRDLGQVLYAWAGLGYRPGERSMERLLQALGSRLQDCSCQTLANTAWALAKLDHSPHPAFLQEIEHQIQTKYSREKSSGSNAKGLSTTIWAFCKLGHAPEPSFLEWIEGALLVQMPELSEQQVGNVLWAYATAGWPMSEELRRRCAARAGELCPRMQPAALGQTMWGLAALGHSPNRWLLTNFHRRCLQVLGKSGPGTIRNAARACEAFHHRDLELAAALCDAFERTSSSWSLPQAVELICSLARLGLRVPDGAVRRVLKKVEEAALQGEPEDSDGDSLLWLAWTLGRVGYRGDVSALRPLLLFALEGTKEARALAQGFQGAAALGIVDVDGDTTLREAFIAKGMAQLADMNPHDATAFSWGAAESGAHLEADDLGALEEFAARKAAALNRSDLVLLPWALCRLGASGCHELRVALAEQVRARQGRQAFTDRELQGLHALAAEWSLPLPADLPPAP